VQRPEQVAPTCFSRSAALLISRAQRPRKALRKSRSDLVAQGPLSGPAVFPAVRVLAAPPTRQSEFPRTAPSKSRRGGRAALMKIGWRIRRDAFCRDVCAHWLVRSNTAHTCRQKTSARMRHPCNLTEIGFSTLRLFSPVAPTGRSRTSRRNAFSLVEGVKATQGWRRVPHAYDVRPCAKKTGPPDRLPPWTDFRNGQVSANLLRQQV
jgi:hypothetical protein